MKLPIPSYINNISPYTPGKPLEALEREYGITDSIKLASNENPLGPSPKALAAIVAACRNMHRYPEEPGYALLHRLADRHDIETEQIVIGNGSDELLGLLSLSFLQPGDEVIIPTPSFLVYTRVAQSAGAVPVKVPLNGMAIDLDAVRAKVGPRTRMMFICNPNNPTGAMIAQPDFDAFVDSLPSDVVVVIDEAYAEFVRDNRWSGIERYLDAGLPIVTLRTFSKAYGLAGLRVGYGVMAAEMAEILNRVRMPFNVNGLAQAAATAALDDTEFLNRTVELVHNELDFLYGELRKRQVRYFPTQTNFFLIDVERDARQVFEQFLRQGVIVRPMTDYGYPQFIRINIGLHDENVRFITALDSVLSKGTRNI
jgi:histidinol-phosphate aminotransferase